MSIALGNGGDIVSTATYCFAFAPAPVGLGVLLVKAASPSWSLLRVALAGLALILAVEATAILELQHLARYGPSSAWWDVHPRRAGWLAAALAAGVAVVAAAPWRSKRKGGQST